MRLVEGGKSQPAFLAPAASSSSSFKAAPYATTRVAPGGGGAAPAPPPRPRSLARSQPLCEPFWWATADASPAKPRLLLFPSRNRRPRPLAWKAHLIPPALSPPPPPPLGPTPLQPASSSRACCTLCFGRPTHPGRRSGCSEDFDPERCRSWSAAEPFGLRAEVFLPPRAPALRETAPAAAAPASLRQC